MGREKYKKICNNIESSMAPPEPRSSTTAKCEHPNTGEEKENDNKNGFMMMMTEDLKEEMRNSLREIEERQAKNRKKSTNPQRQEKTI